MSLLRGTVGGMIVVGYRVCDMYEVAGLGFLATYARISGSVILIPR
jgi:hypothetical protein